jgi:hypothetical protein
MGRADYLELGTWNATCSLCGSKYKANELKKHWTGWYRCTDCWEPRQPQDFVRGVQDVQTVPWSQPESYKFVDVSQPITIEAWDDTYPVDFFSVAIATETGLPIFTE